MNRRHFLATVPFALGGCGGPPLPKVGSRSQADRERHLTLLANCRVSADATRTTPKAPIDVMAHFPELKPLLKVAVRLHPRYSDGLSPDVSKLGGQFLWPVRDDWPRCPEFQVPLHPVLQLRLEDAPPTFPFRPATDLFQLLWTPRATKAGPPHGVGVWRKRGSVTDSLAQIPSTDRADLGYVPVPCRLFPERFTELPPTALMPQHMRERVEAWKSPTDFNTLFAAAPGTKAGGWARGVEAAKCLTCVHPMDYLLTVASAEWAAGSRTRWKPNEDGDEDGFRRAAGLNFGKPDAAMEVYICRRCEKWPLRVVMV